MSAATTPACFTCDERDPSPLADPVFGWLGKFCEIVALALCFTLGAVLLYRAW